MEEQNINLGEIERESITMSMWKVDTGRWVSTFQLSFNSFLGKDRVEIERTRA